MCYGCYDLAGDIVASQHTAMPQIKDIVPSDNNWLEPDSPFQEPENVPSDPVDYLRHNNEPSGSWFHVSPRELAPGTRLTPGGGSGLHDTAPQEWAQGGGMSNRRNHVWLAPNYTKAKFWHSQSGPDAHIYEVKPGDKPQRWNYTGSEGWVAPHAHVIQDVTPTRKERRSPLDWQESVDQTYATGIPGRYNTAAWSGETYEPSKGYKAPTTPYIARGMNVSLPTDDHDLFHAINEHRATPEHMQRLVTNGGKSGAGVWWGTYSHPDAPDPHAYGNFEDFADHAGEGVNPSESVAHYHDSGEYADRVNDAGGQGPNQIFAETPIVMVGKRPQRGNAPWDPEIHNPSNSLMGNSYLDDDEHVDLHEIHYHSGRDWVKVPMPEGTKVRTATRRTMTSAITLYTKPDCQQCVMTKRQLDAHGIPHEVRDVTQDPDAHAFVTGLGYSAAPVVHAGDEDHWSGFRPERIRALLNRDTI